MNYLLLNAKRILSLIMLLLIVLIFELAYFTPYILSQNLNNKVKAEDKEKTKKSLKQLPQSTTNDNKEEITKPPDVDLKNQANSSLNISPSPTPTPLDIKVTLEDKSNIWEKLALVLAGALIGAVASIVGTLIQISRQKKAIELQIEAANIETGRQIKAAEAAATKQIDASEAITTRQIEAAENATRIQLEAKKNQYDEEAKQIQIRLEHQKIQVEKQTELVKILTSQVSIMEATLDQTRLDIFIKKYEILYEELSMMCASILRFVLTKNGTSV